MARTAACRVTADKEAAGGTSAARSLSERQVSTHAQLLDKSVGVQEESHVQNRTHSHRDV